MIGSLIDEKYLVKALLGQGGMGSVYEVEHTGTGRRCAVKVINSGDLTKDPQVLSRFEREARAAGAIDTQYITQVLDAGIDRQSGLPFLAMEFMEGEDLQHLLKRVGPIAPDLALRVLAQACLGLQKAHEAKVVHRDIKPHNLFLATRDAGEVVIKLLDFGIAKVKMDQAQGKDGMDLTRTGNLLGSPLYVSPEQARGKRQIDHRTDIYSLGAVAYQMLCGRTPYEHATALGELILMVCTEPAAPVQDHAPWVVPEVAEVVHRCLKKNPDERYQSAQELFDAIRPMLSGGWAIHESMLVSLADSQRQVEAPRLPMSLPPPAMMDTGGSMTGGSMTGGSMTGGSMMGGTTGGMTAAQTRAASAQTASDGASTTGPLTQAPVTVQPSSSKMPVIVGAVAAIAAAGVGIWFASRPPEPLPPTTQPSDTVAVAPPTVTETATPTPVKAPEPKRVKVVIIPSDCQVEVEGQAATVKDGLLEIEGVPGKVFKVRVFKGISETEAEVVVTEAGALPPKIEVKLGQKIKLTRQDSAAAASATADPTTGAAPGYTPPQKGIKVDEDEFN